MKNLSLSLQFPNARLGWILKIHHVGTWAKSAGPYPWASSKNSRAHLNGRPAILSMSRPNPIPITLECYYK
jgi:hypothetical protein